MAFSGEMCKLLSVLISLVFLLPGVEAMDEGNAIAILFGMVFTGIGFCACLGYYARKRNGQY
ncbi:small integral membrane protein 30 [Pseudophryne corroboree]|uniref:small integral membrane protein 30 n=1 Tax=Pseudophryne corroboree TaxID=495146 RepID=UPI0030812AA6